jgi:hypothetical protein
VVESCAGQIGVLQVGATQVEAETGIAGRIALPLAAFMGDVFLAAPPDDAERRLNVDARGGQGVGPFLKFFAPRVQNLFALGVGFIIRILEPVRPIAEVVVLGTAGGGILADSLPW